MYLVHLEQDPRKRNSVEDQSQDDLADFRPCAEQQIWRGVNLPNFASYHSSLVQKRKTEDDDDLGSLNGGSSFNHNVETVVALMKTQCQKLVCNSFSQLIFE